MELSQAKEAAELHTKSFKPKEISVHKLNSTFRERKHCLSSGRSNHDKASCKFKDAA